MFTVGQLHWCGDLGHDFVTFERDPQESSCGPKTQKRNWSNTTETHITNVSESKVSRRGSHLPHILQLLAAVCRHCNFQVSIFTMPNVSMPLNFNDAEHLGTSAATKALPRCGRRLQPVPSGQVYVEAFTVLTLGRRRCRLLHNLFTNLQGADLARQLAEVGSAFPVVVHHVGLAPQLTMSRARKRRNQTRKELVQSRCALRDRPESWQSPSKKMSFRHLVGRKKIQETTTSAI